MTGRLGIPILAYHFIGGQRSEEGDPYAVSAAGFRRHLRLLRNLGYTSVGVAEVLAMADGAADGPRWPVVLSFDDGHSSFFERAAPALQDYGFGAITFVVADWIGRKGYMGWSEIRDLAEAGFEVGSHSMTHPVLPSLEPEEEWREVAQSKEILEEGLGRGVDVFAYRGGHHERRTREAVRRAGYRAAVSSDRGLNTRRTDRYALRRMSIRHGDGRRHLLRKLSGNRAAGQTAAVLGHLLGRW